MGKKINAVAAPGSVSVKTTVISYVPVGVVADVVMLKELVGAEKLQEVPLGKFRQVTDTFVADDGKVTEYVAVEPRVTDTAGGVKTGGVMLPDTAESTSN